LTTASAAQRERRLFGRRKEALRDFQMALLEPKLGILDETDSGLDIDG
jgi:Fe-S cluster assembly ATPase SufC